MSAAWYGIVTLNEDEAQAIEDVTQVVASLPGILAQQAQRGRHKLPLLVTHIRRIGLRPCGLRDVSIPQAYQVPNRL